MAFVARSRLTVLLTVSFFCIPGYLEMLMNERVNEPGKPKCVRRGTV